MKYFYLAWLDPNGNPLGKNYKEMWNSPDIANYQCEIKSIESFCGEYVENLPDFSRWVPQLNEIKKK